MYNDFRREILIALADAQLDGTVINGIVSKIDMIATRYVITRQSQEIAVRGMDQLLDVAKMYIVTKKIEGCSDSTIENYSLHLKSFISYCNCPLEEIDANTIRKYLLLYKMDHKIGDRSLDHIRQDLACWFKWLQNEGYIARDPMANISRIKFVPEHKPALDQTELERLRDACEDDRDRCLVEVLYSTGCRISEALSIKVADIKMDLPQPEAEVLGKGKKRRTVYFSPRAVSTIKKYLASRPHDSEWLFNNYRAGGQLKRANAEKRFRQLRDLAGLGDKRLTPHTMRHTTATQTIKIAPVNVVQQLLGHSKIETTMQYAETAQDDVKAYHAKAI